MMLQRTRCPASVSGSPGHAPHEPSPLAARPRPWIHPRFRELPPPVIVIGMHRSGTSLVAAVLQALGVYMGPPDRLAGERTELSALDGRPIFPGYAEAEDFRQLNELLLRRAGADWDRIEPFLRLRYEPRFARASVATLQMATFGRLRTSYLWPEHRGVAGPWGWKDPRTSLTLPYWLRLFPRARIVHVSRDTEDVVESLYRRAHGWQAPAAPPFPLGRRLRGWAEHPIPALTRAGQRCGLLPPPPPDPCLDRDYCRDLCREYVRECLRYREWGERYLQVSYEALVEEPLIIAGQLARFVGCSPVPSRLLEAAIAVRRQRRRVPWGAAGMRASPVPEMGVPPGGTP